MWWVWNSPQECLTGATLHRLQGKGKQAASWESRSSFKGRRGCIHWGSPSPLPLTCRKASRDIRPGKRPLGGSAQWTREIVTGSLQESRHGKAARAAMDICSQVYAPPTPVL